jgi:hypothetical protein
LPEFTALSEAEVLRSLDDPGPENPVANEVARLITGYAENFKAHLERLGAPEEGRGEIVPSLRDGLAGDRSFRPLPV